jgi:16S rRNA (guanine966-N2)-methyltransferase
LNSENLNFQFIAKICFLAFMSCIARGYLMRITGGIARGIPLQLGRAKNLRPATDKMRERIFSSLSDRIEECKVLDLFAGTGAYGLESLSRGASEVLFVEKQNEAIQAIQRNLEAVLKSMGTSSNDCYTVMRADALKFNTAQRFSVIFADPPYPLLRSRYQEILSVAHACIEKTSPAYLILEKPGDLRLVTEQWSLVREWGKSGTNEPSALLLSPAK